MLILTCARTYLWVAKYLFIFIIIIGVSACSDNKDDAQTTATEEDASDKLNGLTEDQLLDDSVRQEQQHNGATESAQAPQNNVISGLESTLSESDSANKEVAITDVDTKSLIEDLGFSGAQENQEDPTVTSPHEFFCLNTSRDTTIKQSTEEEACRKISNRLASVKYEACEAAKLQPTGCSSVKGFPILMSEFAPIPERKPQGKILIVGGTHGDELTSVSMTLRWIEKLNNHHSGLFHWHLVPMMNPDGVLKKGATRTNGNGVDLNRNMPSDDWERNAIKYWVEKGDKNPRKYPGEAASSEPETQWLIDEIESFKPDAIISVHAPYGVVDFDSLLLKAAPKNLGKLHLNLLGTYPGSLGNYAGINRNIPVITLELPHSWVMPSEAESTKIWEDIVSWLKKNVNTEMATN